MPLKNKPILIAILSSLVTVIIMSTILFVINVKNTITTENGFLDNNIANIILTNTGNDFYVNTQINIDDYPQLMDMRKGADILIQGMIYKIDYKKSLIYIKDPLLKFF